MRHTQGRMLALALGLGAVGSAGAVEKGGELYVRVKNTRLMKGASATSNVVTTLQPPQAVTWLGASADDRQWHEVRVGKRKGFVFQPNLSTQPPDMELVGGSKGRKVDAKAFASSGAAVKALSSGTLEANKEVGAKEAATQLKKLLLLARTVKDADLVEHAMQAGLPPVVEPTRAQLRKFKARASSTRSEE